MKTGWLLQAGIVLAVGVMGLVSCTKEQLDQYTTRSGNTVTLSLPASSDSGKPNSHQPASPNAGGSSDQKTSTVAPSGKPNSQEPASPNTGGSSDQRASTIATPAGDAPTSNSGSKSVGSGGVGPDVIGLRIGMTPAEARPIIKSHASGFMLTPTLHEVSQALCFDNFCNSPIPKTDIVTTITDSEDTQDHSNYGIGALFASFPGHEGLLRLTWSEGLSDSRRPTLAVFRKALVEKYGTPTLWNQKFPQLYYWSYDSNGALRKPGSIIISPQTLSVSASLDGRICRFLDGTNSVPYEVQNHKKGIDNCGAILLFVELKYDIKNEIVWGYEFKLQGFDAAIRAYYATKAVVDKASADANAAATKKAQQQKPDF